MKTLLDEAIAHHGAGRLVQAEANYRELLKDDPGHPYANNNLAVLLRSQSRFDEAIALYYRAIAAVPDEAAFRSNMVGVLTSLDRHAEALASARVAVALSPEYAEGWFNLGMTMQALGDRHAAKLAYRRALLADPSLGEAYCNLAELHQINGDLILAENSFRTAIRAKPALPQPFANLGELLKSTGRVVDAIRLLREATDRHPAVPVLHSNLLLALHYTPLVPPEVIWRAHKRWNVLHAQPLLPKEPMEIADCNPVRRLRIGYVSPDFCAHPVARFFEPLLHNHDPLAIETFCYALSPKQDEVTARIKARSNHWISLVNLSDEEAVARIRRDCIDILVDLTGHTAGSRPLLFARKPAPIQVTWLGYPDTTGMTAIDYRLTDAIADPPGLTERWHSESLVRLPNGFLSYLPTVDIPPASVPPSNANGFITFGSFNNIAKVTPEVIRLWGMVLRCVPNSRFLLKGGAFSDAATRERFLNRFEQQGIDANRVELDCALVPSIDHFSGYGRMDISLDTMPYNGTTTTCEALWMGVPVISLPGQHHVARVSASILTYSGLSELIANTPEDYVEKAVTLAKNPKQLAAYRQNLRSRLRAAPIMDHARFARDVEAAFRVMWRYRLKQGSERRRQIST